MSEEEKINYRFQTARSEIEVEEFFERKKRQPGLYYKKCLFDTFNMKREKSLFSLLFRYKSIAGPATIFLEIIPFFSCIVVSKLLISIIRFGVFVKYFLLFRFLGFYL